MCSTDLCIILHISTIGSRESEKPNSVEYSLNYPLPTPIKASSGHSVNQSIVQQLTKEGNILSLVWNLSLNGDIARTR